MIDTDLKERAALMSPTWARFLDYIEHHPEYARPADLSEVRCDYPVQSWPTFITSEKRAEIAEATMAVFRLLKTIPSKIFENDAARIATYYRVAPRALAPFFFEPPNGLDIAIGRADFIDGDAGFQCVELNPYGSLGGLETEFMLEAYRHTPPFARFIEDTGIQPRFDRCVLTLFGYMIDVARERGIADDEVNIAVVADGIRPAFGAYGDLPQRCYTQALADNGGLRGTLILCEQHAIRERNGDLYCDGKRLHVVWEYAVLKHYPPRFVMAFKRGRIAYFNSPSAGILGCKRSLVLLSQALETDLYDDADRAAIERHVPWSRALADTDVTFDGTRWSLVELLRANRGDFVVKKGLGYGGDDVHLGECTSADRWDAIIRAGIEEGTWLVQRFVDPKRFAYQSGEDGPQPCKAVWGGFCYGERFGGAYLRVFPGHRTGPINSARGAMTGLVFEA